MYNFTFYIPHLTQSNFIYNSIIILNHKWKHANNVLTTWDFPIEPKNPFTFKTHNKNAIIPLNYSKKVLINPNLNIITLITKFNPIQKPKSSYPCPTKIKNHIQANLILMMHIKNRKKGIISNLIQRGSLPISKDNLQRIRIIIKTKNQSYNTITTTIKTCL